MTTALCSERGDRQIQPRKELRTFVPARCERGAQVQRCERLFPLGLVGCPSAAARVSNASKRALAASEAPRRALRTALVIPGDMHVYIRRRRAPRGTLAASP